MPACREHAAHCEELRAKHRGQMVFLPLLRGNRRWDFEGQMQTLHLSRRNTLLLSINGPASLCVETVFLDIVPDTCCTFNMPPQAPNNSRLSAFNDFSAPSWYTMAKARPRRKDKLLFRHCMVLKSRAKRNGTKLSRNDMEYRQQHQSVVRQHPPQYPRQIDHKPDTSGALSSRIRSVIAISSCPLNQNID